MDNKLLFEKIQAHLQKYNCHTLILYGSYSSGDYTAESDIDIVGFSDSAEETNDVENVEGKQLDAWIYNTGKMAEPNQFLHINKGTILLDEKGVAQEFLMDIQQAFDKGPEVLSSAEKDFLKSWLRKMYQRAKKNDLEGNYRLHWMLKDSLEIYFELKGVWYLGPKKAFVWLRENDEAAFDFFKHAFEKDANEDDIENLLEFLNEI
jgi:predicted nucleotidyltransferase